MGTTAVRAVDLADIVQVDKPLRSPGPLPGRRPRCFRWIVEAGVGTTTVRAVDLAEIVEAGVGVKGMRRAFPSPDNQPLLERSRWENKADAPGSPLGKDPATWSKTAGVGTTAARAVDVTDLAEIVQVDEPAVDLAEIVEVDTDVTEIVTVGDTAGVASSGPSRAPVPVEGE